MDSTFTIVTERSRYVTDVAIATASIAHVVIAPVLAIAAYV